MKTSKLVKPSTKKPTLKKTAQTARKAAAAAHPATPTIFPARAHRPLPPAPPQPPKFDMAAAMAGAHGAHGKLITRARGQMIYGPEDPPPYVYLVLEGAVKVETVEPPEGSDNEHAALMDLHQAGEVFGLGCMSRGWPASGSPVAGGSGGSLMGESAVAIDPCRLLCWSAAEVETAMSATGSGLLRLLVARELQYRTRIEMMSLEQAPRRLARALIELGRRFGGAGDAAGEVQVKPFTHEVLSKYVGASREIITRTMNRFRREGLIRYTREAIYLDVAALDFVWRR